MQPMHVVKAAHRTLARTGFSQVGETREKNFENGVAPSRDRAQKVRPEAMKVSGKAEK